LQSGKRDEEKEAKRQNDGEGGRGGKRMGRAATFIAPQDTHCLHVFVVDVVVRFAQSLTYPKFHNLSLQLFRWLNYQLNLHS